MFYVSCVLTTLDKVDQYQTNIEAIQAPLNTKITIDV